MGGVGYSFDVGGFLLGDCQLLHPADLGGRHTIHPAADGHFPQELARRWYGIQILQNVPLRHRPGRHFSAIRGPK